MNSPNHLAIHTLFNKFEQFSIMEPGTLTSTAIATLLLIKATEKAGEKLGEQVVNQGGKLLSLLKNKLPSTANAIEIFQQQPLDYDKAVLELEQATQDPKIARAVEELDVSVKADPKLSEVVQALANTLKSQPSTVQNYEKLADFIKNVFQGNTFIGGNF